MKSQIAIVGLFVVKALVLVVNCGPVSRSKAVNTDERQTGDYNVRLHLKDFQIIAILGSDSMSPSNDNYEYDYEIPDDYLDITTLKPTNTTQSSTTVRPSRKPTTQATTTKPKRPSTTVKPVTFAATTAKSTSEAPIQATESVSEAMTEKIAAERASTTERLQEKLEMLTIDKIPVVIMQENVGGAGNDSFKTKTPEVPVNSVAIVPVEDFGDSNSQRPISLGEILHYKRCSNGYARDKRGRCRKIRRPQLPFDIGRLATNLASKLKYSKEDPLSEPIED